MHLFAPVTLVVLAAAGASARSSGRRPPDDPTRALTVRGDLVHWNDARAVYRNGRLLARFRSSAEDDGVIANLRRYLETEVPVAADDEFTVCFEPPVLREPDAEVRERVALQAPLLARSMAAAGFRDAAWLEAIITHESGGDPGAVSPTGCAGLAAMCENPGGTPRCCVADRGDGYRTIYDLCNSERSAGYRCDRTQDTRFDPDVAARYVVERLQEVSASIDHLRRRGIALSPERVVPMAYNAGLGCFPRFPAQSQSVPTIMSQLEFARGRYPGWNRQSLANKVVEIYDYLRWFPYLVEYWQSAGGGSVRRPGDDAGAVARELMCFHNSSTAQHRFTRHASDSLGAILLQQALRPIRVRRLSFGSYAHGPAYYAEGAWLN